VGINLGDVVIDGDDIHGDGVNVAARLEGLAIPGGIYVSDAVHEQVRDRIDVPFEDLGDQEVKNIDRPVHVWRWAKGTSAGAHANPDTLLPLPDKPSIAVLPFTNMSGDPDQEYFSDGITEDIITALSRIRQFFVIARNTTFTFKDRAVDVQSIAKELGVRYVLEGSVRKAGSRVRITAQLIEGASGNHLWAERYDRQLEDIFEVQDEITQTVVAAIAPTIRTSEIERARRKRPDSLVAYDYVMRALPNVWALTPNASAEAVQLANEAVRLDPDFAFANALAGWSQVWQVVNGWSPSPAQAKTEGLRLARRALMLDGDDPGVLTMVGAAEMMLAHNLEAASVHIGKALVLDPNSAWAWLRSGYLHVYQGDAETALEHFGRAERLSPYDPLNFNRYIGIALAHFVAERYEEASEWAEKSLLERSDLPWAYRVLAAAQELTGKNARARWALEKMRQQDPDISVSRVMTNLPFAPSEVFSRFADSLRRVGLPE
jgi:adenylate cyclase